MAECFDKKLGNKLNAYEIGMLTGDEREEFEMHLMKCEACVRKTREFKKAADILRLSENIKTFVHDLAEKERKVENSETAFKAKKRRKLWPRFVSVGGITIIIAILLILKPWHIEIQPTKEAIAFENTLAIMYFGNLVDEEDADRMGAIATDLLITGLSESDYMRVVSGQRLYDILRQLGYENQTYIAKDIASRVADKARAKWMLTGNLLQTEPSIVLTSQLIDVQTGEVINSQEVSGNPGEDIFAVTDKLSAAIKSDLSLPVEALEEPEIPVIDLTTNSLEAYKLYLEGRRLFYKGFRAESKLALRKAIALDSTFAMAYLPLVILLASDRDPEALLLISDASKFAYKATARERAFIRALYAFLHKNYDECNKLLIELTKSYPDDKHAFYWLGWQTLHIHKKPVKAIEYFSKVLELDSLFMRAYEQTAKAYFDLNNYEKSMWTLNKYIDIDPHEAHPYYDRARINYRKRNFDMAIQDFEKAIQLKSNLEGPYEYLAPLYLRKSDFDKALLSYQTLASDHNSSARRSDFRTALALVSMFQGKFDEALNILTEGIRQDSLESTFHGNEGDMAHRYYFKAKIFMEKKDSDSTLYYMEHCINTCYRVMDESNTCFAQDYIQILSDLKELEHAELMVDELMQKLEDNDQSPESYWYSKACIELSRRNFEQAEDYINKAVGQGGNLDYDYKQAEIYLASKQAEKAIKAFEKIKSSQFASYRPILLSKLDYNLGLAYELIGQIDKAKESYSAFLNAWKDADPWIEAVTDSRRRLSQIKDR